MGNLASLYRVGCSLLTLMTEKEQRPGRAAVDLVLEEK